MRKFVTDGPGCPDENDIIVRVMTTIKAGAGMERRGPYAAHNVCDTIIQEIREVLKKLVLQLNVSKRTYKPPWPSEGCAGKINYGTGS